MSEKWKVLELEGLDIYEISSYGRVRTRARIYEFDDGSTREYRPYLRKLFQCARGFVSVTLLDDNGKRHTLRVHRLVALHFLPRHGKRHVLHVDGNKRNNMVNNLLWVDFISKTTYIP